MDYVLIIVPPTGTPVASTDVKNRVLRLGYEQAFHQFVQGDIEISSGHLFHHVALMKSDAPTGIHYNGSNGFEVYGALPMGWRWQE